MAAATTSRQRALSGVLTALLLAPLAVPFLLSEGAAQSSSPGAGTSDDASQTPSAPFPSALDPERSEALRAARAQMLRDRELSIPRERAPDLRDVAPEPPALQTSAARAARIGDVATKAAPEDAPAMSFAMSELSAAEPAPDAWAEASSEAEQAVEEAARYILGYVQLPEVSPGDKVNGDVVLERNDGLGFLVLATSDVDASLARAATLEGVVYAEADPDLAWVTYAPEDPLFLDQYAPREVRLPEAWDTTLGSSAAAVCIVDSGVLATHEDLTGARFRGGYDFVNGDADPTDDNGHGTHVAGIAAATIGNALGVAGAANVDWYAVKVLNSAGSGSFSQIAAGIQWCTENTPQNTVISLSLGAAVGSFALREAVEAAAASGRLVVAAAGNDGPCSNCVGFPARYDDAIAVGCVDPFGALCSFSSAGPQLDVVAPGAHILSTCAFSTTSYCEMSGTSMSTPLVSGALALVWSAQPSLSAEQLRVRLLDGLVERGEPGADDAFGRGLLDAACLVAGTAPCADVLPPVVRWAAFTDDGTLEIVLSEPLGEASVVDEGELSALAGETALAVSSAEIEGAILRIRFTPEPPVGIAITLTHAPDATPLQDAAGNPLPAFTGLPLDTTLLPDPANEAAGPDLGGYTFATSRVANGPTYSWTEVPEDAVYLPLGDDDMEGPFALPFPFSFYGEVVHEYYVSSNGFLQLGSTGYNPHYCGQPTIPNAADPNMIVAGMWTDLYPPSSNGVSVATVGDAGARVFMLTFDSVPYFSSSELVSFQIKLLEADGAIEIHYRDVGVDWDWCGLQPRIGMEGPGGLAGLMYDQGSLPFAGRAIRFTPSTDTLRATVLASEPSAIVDEAITFTAQVEPSEGASIASWAWDFGDGSTSAEAAPVHAFAASGAYRVSVLVTDDQGRTARAERDLLVLAPGTLPAGLSGAASATHGGATYFFGGEDGALVRYDHATGIARHLGARVPAAEFGAAAWGGDAFYLFGGFGPGPADRIHRFDPATGDVRLLDVRLPAERDGLAAVFDPAPTESCPAGCIYLLGGSSIETLLPTILRFDPVGESIATMAAQLPVGLWTPSAALADGSILVFGGDSWMGPSGAIFRYDPTLDVVATMDADVPVPTHGLAAVSDGEHVFLAGGWDAALEARAHTWRYDAATDTLVPLAHGLPEGRAFAAARLHEGDLLLLGGEGNEVLSSALVAVPTLVGALSGPVVEYAAASVEDGRLVDLSGHGDHGTLVGATIVDGAIRFAGPEHMVNTTHQRLNISAFTLAVRLRTSTPGTGIMAYHQSQTSVGAVDAVLSLDEQGRVRFAGSHAQLQSRRAIADDAWHDVRVVAGGRGSAEDVSLYVDGILEDRAAAPPFWTGPSIQDGYWRLGRTSSTALPTFAGDIEALSIHDRALTNAELAPSLYSGLVHPSMPTTLSLLASERLDPATLGEDLGFSLVVDGVPTPLAGVTLGEREVLLDLPAAPAFGVPVSVSFAGGSLADVQGEPIAPFEAPISNLLPDPALEASATPDLGGYTFLSNVAGGAPFAFTDISETGQVAYFDVASWAIPLGFDFAFYGQVQRNVHLGATGILSFGKDLPASACVATALPDAGGPASIVALDGPVSPSEVRYQTLGVAPERTFIAQWTGWNQDQTPYAFQVRLNEADGSIATAYKNVILAGASVASECPARVGIQMTNGTAGLSYRLGVGSLDGIQVVYQPPSAGAAAVVDLSQPYPLANEIVTLADAGSILDATAWSWAFGDGAESTEAAPTHAWAEPGTYIVTLTVTDALGAIHRAARRVEVVEPGVVPIDVVFAGTMMDDGMLYAVPDGALTSYSGAGSPILRYDVARNAIHELEAEVPIGNTAGAVASTWGGGFLFMPTRPDLGDGAVYFFDAERETLSYEGPMPNAVLGAEAVFDPTPTDECPDGCAYLAGGAFWNVATDAAQQGIGLGEPTVYRYSPDDGTFEALGEVLPETYLDHALAVDDGELYVFGGRDVALQLTDAVTEVDVWEAEATVVAHALPAPTTLARAVWTGERFLVLSGYDAAGGTSPDVLSFDPYSGEVSVLASFATAHASGAFAYTGAGIAVLGGAADDGAESVAAVRTVQYIDLPPQIRNMTARDATVVLEYSETLPDAFLPAANAFVVKRNGVAVPVLTVVRTTPMHLTLTLASGVAYGDKLTLAYEPGAGSAQGATASAASTSDAPASNAPMGFSNHPITNAAPPTIATEPATANGLAGWFTSTPVSVRIDAPSTVTRLYCIGAGCTPTTRYTAPIAVGEGSTTIRARTLADDAVSDIVTRVVNVDVTSPTVVLSGDSGSVPGTSATFTLTFSEPMDRGSTEAALGGVAGWQRVWSDSDKVLTLSHASLPQGTHTLSIAGTALDAHGRALTLPASPTRSVTVTAAPPPPQPAPAPPPPPPPPQAPDAPTGLAATLDGTNATLTWSPPAQTNGAPVTGYRITLNGAPAGETSGTSFSLSGLARGVSHVFGVSAVNSAGQGPAAVTSAGIPPTGTISVPAGGASGWHKSAPAISFTTDPAGATVLVDVGQGETTFGDGFSLPPGDTRLKWRVTSGGLTSPTTETRIRYDPTPPVLARITLSSATLAANDALVITARATDAHSGVASVVALVGGTRVTLAPQGEGTYQGSLTPTTAGSIEVVATDAAGNEARASGGSFTVAAPEEEEEETEEEPTTPTSTLPGGLGSASGGAIPLESTSTGGNGGGAPPASEAVPVPTPEGSSSAAEDDAEPEPVPPEVVLDQPADVGAKGTITIRIANFPELPRLRIVLIAPDLTETLLAEGQEVTTWDTTLSSDGYYTIEARLGPATVASNAFTIQSTHTNGEVLATLPVLVRNDVKQPEVAAAVVVSAAVFTAATHAGLSAAASAGGSAATASVGAGAGGFHPLDFLREVAVDAGQDKLRDKTKDKAALDRRRRIRSVVAAIAGIVILGSLWAFAETDGWSWGQWLLILPLVGTAAALVTLMKYSSESALAFATHARPRIRLWVAGTISLAISAIVFRSPFGYPAWVDETGESESQRTWKRQALRAGATIAGGAAFSLPFLALSGVLPWAFVSVGILIAYTNLATSAMPFGPLPGKDIWRWNKWIAVGVAVLGLAIYVAYSAALVPMWAFWTIGILGAGGYAGTLAYFRRTLGPKPRRVPVAVPVPVRDADAEAKAGAAAVVVTVDEAVKSEERATDQSAGHARKRGPKHKGGRKKR